MPSLAELSSAIAAYRAGSISIDNFEDWFRDNSRGMFGESERMIAACIAVEAAFSRIRFDEATEIEFQQELANAIRPFEPQMVRYAAQAPVSVRSPRNISPSISQTQETSGWGMRGKVADLEMAMCV